MSREMLVNVAEREECRVAVIDNGTLEELYTERASWVSHVGNIYKGKVINIESSIQAAFIDSIELSNRCVTVKCNVSPFGTIRIDEIQALIGLPTEQLAGPVRRVEVVWK